MKFIYLGSSSLARKTLLEDLGYEVIPCPSNVDETLSEKSDSVEAVVTAIARRKTDAVLASLNGLKNRKADLLVCGDVVVVNKEDEILEKPKSREEALAWLKHYAETRWVGTVQAIEVTNIKTGKRVAGTDRAGALFKLPFPEKALPQYLDTSNAMNAAGALIIEHPFVWSHVDRIEGDIDSIMGLSKNLVQSLISTVDKDEEKPIAAQ